MGENKKSQQLVELAWLIVILSAGISIRLIFVTLFPTIPVSDFSSLVNMALIFQNDLISPGLWQWHYFSPGLPLLLSVLFQIVPGSPEFIARSSSAVISGLVPLLPYLIWKDVYSLKARIFAGLTLAFWFGQVIFSGVVAQDNWVVFPSVALVSITLRSLGGQKDTKLWGWSALCYVVAVAIRQEMLLVLLPALMMVAIDNQIWRTPISMFRGGMIIVIVFGSLMFQRGTATGHYTLSTAHLGTSILGSYIPGAGLNWLSPVDYIKSRDPDLLENGIISTELDNAALRFALDEFLLRSGFHIIRIFGTTTSHILQMDGQIAYWSLLADDVLPIGSHNLAWVFFNKFSFFFKFSPLLINSMFTIASVFVFHRWTVFKNLSPIFVTILLKIGIHAVIVSQPRYYLVVMAMEILVIAVVWDAMSGLRGDRLVLKSILLGLAVILLVWTGMHKAESYVMTHAYILLPFISNHDKLFENRRYFPLYSKDSILNK